MGQQQKHVTGFAASIIVVALAVALAAEEARAACGCMIPWTPPGPTATAKSARITNSATKVVMMRKGDKTTVIMSNDFDGDVQEFGLVIPVPSLVQKRDVRLVEPSLFARLEKATAPRIVKLEEQDPCGLMGGIGTMGRGAGASFDAATSDAVDDASAKSLGVVAKAKFAVGEYDVTVLSAEQSTGLLTWLDQNGYRVPKVAADVLESYIKQNNFFLVAKVDARRLSRSGRSFLKPLLVNVNTPKFVLPIRLGMVNNDGLQELLVFTFADGRVEPTNYRAAKLDTGQAVPAFVADDVDASFEQLFATATKNNETRAVFTEWAGVLSTNGILPSSPRFSVVQAQPEEVDGKAAARCPIPPGAKIGDNLRVGWSGGAPQFHPAFVDAAAAKPTIDCITNVVSKQPRGRLILRVVEESPSMFATRLHFRYDEDHFPEDLVLQVTKDRAPVRSKWYARVPWRGATSCPAATKYLAISEAQLEKEIDAWAALSGVARDEVSKRAKPR